MTRFFSSLRVRLLLPVLLAIVSAAGLLLYSALEDRRKDIIEAQEHALRLARLAASAHEQVIQGARQLLFGLVRLPEVRRGEPAACSAFFAGLLQQYPLYANLGTMRPNGDAFCSAVPLTRPVNAADMAWFQRVLRSRGFAVGGYQIGRITGMPVLVFGAPVLDPAGRVQAVVFAALDLKWFNMLAAETRLPEGSTLAVIDRHGTILTRHPNPEQWVGKRVPDASLLKAMETRGQGMIEGTGPDGVERLYAFTPLGRAPDPGVYVKIGIPKAVALAEANRSLAQSLIVLGLVATLALASSWVGGHLLILRPVAGLVRATERLSAGDLTARTGLRTGQGELSQLARAFDDMAEALERDTAERKRAEGALRESEERYRTILDQAGDAVFMHDETGRLLEVNRKACQNLGYSREELLSKSVGDIDPDAIQAGRDRLWNAILAGACETFESRHMRKDGTAMPVEVTLGSVRLPQGPVVLGLARDITDRKRAEEALRQSEEKFRRAFEDVSIGMCLTEADGRLVEVNEALCTMLGYSKAELTGRTFGEITHPDDFEPSREWVRRMLAGEAASSCMEKRYLRKNGEVLWALVTTSLLRDADGAPLHFITQIQDITERKRAEEALRERTRQLQSIRAVTIEITRELGLQNLLKLIVQRAVELLGVASGRVWLWNEPAQVLEPHAWQGMGEWVREMRRRPGEGVAGRVFQSGAGLIVNDYRTSPYAHPNGLRRPGVTAVIAEPLLYRDRLVGVIALDNEGTGRRFTPQDGEILALFAAQAAIAIENARLFHSVAEQGAQLRALAARLADTEEAERRRIARELHDRVGQNLTALSLNLNILRDQLPPPVAERLAARLTDSMKLVEETVGQIRGVMADLRPPVLDDYGLMAALRWYGEQFSTRTGVAVSVRGEDPTPRPPQAVESALFRIAQEALTNVGKHARATRAEVGLESDEAVVRMTIADDGVGFDPTTARAPAGGTGWGLVTMRERATGAGGTLRVDSAPGRGTRVTVEIGRASGQ